MASQLAEGDHTKQPRLPLFVPIMDPDTIQHISMQTDHCATSPKQHLSMQADHCTLL